MGEEFAFPYLDEDLAYSEDFKSQIHDLRKVFDILKKHGSKVKAKKYKLLQKETNCLGW